MKTGVLLQLDRDPELRNPLSSNLQAVCSSVTDMLKDIRDVGGFQLAEVSLQVEIGAEGGIELIGTSKVSGSGAISLTFKKP